MLDLTGEDSKLEKWGPSVTALVMRLRATALASMILQVVTTLYTCVLILEQSGLSQEDWTWFFGEQSEYVSHVVENTEVDFLQRLHKTFTHSSIPGYSCPQYVNSLGGFTLGGHTCTYGIVFTYMFYVTRPCIV